MHKLAYFGTTVAVFAIAVALAVSCGGDSSGVASNGGGSSGKDGGGDVSSGGSSGFPSGDSGNCPQGKACEDGGICAGNVCCAADRACADQCCTTGEVCSFNACVTPGASCTDSADCSSGHYCDYALGEPGSGASDAGSCVGGATFPTGRCMPEPPLCPPGSASDAGTPSCLEKCEYVPPTASFTPVQKYYWGGQIAAPFDSDVMMTPIVVQLDDDDCDGKITERDIPEIAFSTFSSGSYVGTGTLHAISIVNGALIDKWSAPDVGASRQLAGGNIDGQPGNELVGCSPDGTTTKAFRGDGSLLWSSPGPICNEPAIADLDTDGKPEVIVEGGILDGATGTVESTFSPAMVGTFAVADVTGDGKLDVVANTQIFDASGQLVAYNGAPDHAWTGGTHFRSGPAVADLDKDGTPEIVAVYFLQHQLAIWQYDAAAANKVKIIRDAIDINGTLDPALCPIGSAGSKWGGGPATVGDFNGDGFPDVALAGGVGYAVFDGKKLMDTSVDGSATFLWTKQTHDCSSAGTGSSLFDFNGDGKAEVVYADEFYFRIYEGATGAVLFETCNTSGTLSEYPLVADVDNDGEADIVVAGNAYAYACPSGERVSGIRVFGSAAGDWVRTRRVWNQHAYQITNVGEDGSIPINEQRNWTVPGLNNFRLNRQPGSEFAATDAIVDLHPNCGKPYALVAIVRNLGQASLPAGVKVDFYAGTPPGGTLLGSSQTSVTLAPAQAENVVLELASPPPDVLDGTTPVYAQVTVAPPTHECREDNNTSPPRSGACNVPR